MMYSSCIDFWIVVPRVTTVHIVMFYIIMADTDSRSAMCRSDGVTWLNVYYISGRVADNCVYYHFVFFSERQAN